MTRLCTRNAHANQVFGPHAFSIPAGFPGTRVFRIPERHLRIDMAPRTAMKPAAMANGAGHVLELNPCLFL